jgi:hypothetical protein
LTQLIARRTERIDFERDWDDSGFFWVPMGLELFWMIEPKGTESRSIESF